MSSPATPPADAALAGQAGGPARGTRPAGSVEPGPDVLLDELRSMLAGQGLPVAADPSAPNAARAEGTAGLPAALRWAASGLMWLTGPPGRAPLVPDGPVLGRAEAAARLFGELSRQLGRAVWPDVATLLGGRAALLGLHRRGTWSANGSCRLLPAADGWIAVNLARPHDVDAVDALVGALGDQLGLVSADPCLHPVEQAWTALSVAVAARPAADVVDVARLLAIPAGELGGPRRPRPVRTVLCRSIEASRPHRAARPTPSAPASPRIGAAGAAAGVGAEPLLVVDLSAMWAGPLCAHLLGEAGMRVVKVESVHRPDGARGGDPEFYDWLHAGHESVALDFATPGGRALLRRLVERADVVIESSRPRALAQLGLDAGELVAARPGRTWVSITGYGRAYVDTHPGPDPVAFGDDAAVAGGLVAWDRSGGDAVSPVFCGDAIADPLTGLFAAVAVAASVLRGGGHLLDVAMRDVAAWVAAPPDQGMAPPDGGTGPADRGVGPAGPVPWTVTGCDRDGWNVHQAGRTQQVLPPRPPQWGPGAREAGRARAAASGADTRTVVDALCPD
ncbi:CoA transferase [Frankia sp. AvcI1]|uniref:CoA transferase n=2 Tax=Frankia sp. AvcI1 TaxID=573496 RepID=UPI0021182885|nr:CoA transferase [Frankia sp. AvcI1]